MNGRPWQSYPIDQIRQWIQEGKTQQWIGEQIGETAKQIQKLCKKAGIKCRRTGPRSGQEHPEWNGGKIRVKHGYVKVYKPDHWTCIESNLRRKAKSKGGYVRKMKYIWEHRLVMEEHLGRRMKPNEVVHHINGIRDDNRIENLVLFERNSDHLRHELAGKCPKWTEDGKQRLRAATNRKIANAKKRPVAGGRVKTEAYIRYLENKRKSVAY